MTTYNAHVSDLHFAKEKVYKDLKENKHRRLSALFRIIRKTDSVGGIGDWPIMSMIVQVVSRFKDITRMEIRGLCRQSSEYNSLARGMKKRYTDSLIESINY